MEEDKEKQTGMPDIPDLAGDVARLYSLADVEEIPYRTFSRQRKPKTSNPHLSELSQEAATPQDSSTQAPETGHEPPPAMPEPITATAIPPADIRTEKAPAMLPEPSLHKEDRAPVELSEKNGARTTVAIYSLAGGVGKTTLCANLGRVLCAHGEQVLLVDTSGSGLLPFYFGASDLRFGLRTFVDPDVTYPAMHVIGAEHATPAWLENDVKPVMQTVQRTIFDLGPASNDVLAEVLSLSAVLLVPLLSDLNSMLTVSRIETSVQAMRDKGIQAPLPFYIFNKFEEQSPRNLEARNLIARQYHERLLSITIRRSPEVSEAISERMTVADHAPDSAVTQDFTELAEWLRRRVPIRQAVRHGSRWSER